MQALPCAHAGVRSGFHPPASIVPRAARDRAAAYFRNARHRAAALLRDACATLDVGRSDETASLFVDVLTTAAPQFRAEAWTDLARSRASSRRNGEAAILAAAMLRHHAPSLASDGDVERARYLLGRSSFDAGDFDTAALAFHRVEAGGGPLSTVARLRLAQALAAPVDGGARRDAEAVAAFRATAAGAATPDDLRHRRSKRERRCPLPPHPQRRGVRGNRGDRARPRCERGDYRFCSLTGRHLAP